jgi:enoyl-CoA hydratase/carnithine racemase
MADLEISSEAGVVTATLNRPAKANAFTLEMIDGLVSAVEQTRRDPEARVFVITGAGDAFCAGADFTVLGHARTPYERKMQLVDHVQRLAIAIAALPKPSLAVVNGSAIGAGLDIALMCDMRLAGAAARLCTGYIRVGIVPGAGGAYYLPRLVGISNALELLMTGRTIDAQEALRMGMVNAVHPDEALQSEAAKLAEILAGQSPIPMAMIRSAVYQSATSDLQSSLDLISSHMGIVHASEDSAEAISAFREKRRPVFRSK